MKRLARGLTGLAVFVLVVLIVGLFYLARDYRQWQASSGWVAVPSTSFLFRRGEVHYAYEINGRLYENRRVQFFEKVLFRPGTYDPDWAEAHRGVTEVTVYYDPAEPAQSVLVREVEETAVYAYFANLLLGCGIIVAPLLFFLLYWRWFWRKIRP